MSNPTTPLSHTHLAELSAAAEKLRAAFSTASIGLEQAIKGLAHVHSSIVEIESHAETTAQVAEFLASEKELVENGGQPEQLLAEVARMQKLVTAAQAAEKVAKNESEVFERLACDARKQLIAVSANYTLALRWGAHIASIVMPSGDGKHLHYFRLECSGHMLSRWYETAEEAAEVGMKALSALDTGGIDALAAVLVAEKGGRP